MGLQKVKQQHNLQNMGLKSEEPKQCAEYFKKLDKKQPQKSYLKGTNACFP